MNPGSQAKATRGLGQESRMNDTFTIRQSGHIGQEILDQDGNIIAWMTDPWVAQVVCKLLTENEELLRRKERKDGTRLSDGSTASDCIPGAALEQRRPRRMGQRVLVCFRE